MEDIIYTDYRHAERMSKYFKIKNLGEHHDLHVQRDTTCVWELFDTIQKL